MTAVHVLKFGLDTFTLRPAAGEFDLELARMWSREEPDHDGRLAPEFWLCQGPRTDSYLLSDPRGPLLFFRIDLIAKPDGTLFASLHIQFTPIRQPIDRLRICDGLREGIEWLVPMLAASGIGEIFSDTPSDRLIRFAVKRLGFSQVGNTIIRQLHPGEREQASVRSDDGAD